MNMYDRYDKCIYPECVGKIVNGKSINGLCIKHSDFLKFFIWALDNIQIRNEEESEKSNVNTKEG